MGMDYSWIGETVSTAVDDVGSSIALYFQMGADDPCVRTQQVAVNVSGWIDTLIEVEAWAAEAHALILAARQQTLWSYGTDARANGVSSFPVYLTQAAGIGAWAGMNPTTWENWVINMMPAGGGRPPGDRTDGMPIPMIGLGVGIDPGGFLRGYRLVEAYDAWVALVGSQVGPSTWPTWMQDYAGVVGDIDWEPGDEAGGWLGQLRELVDNATEYMDEVELLCLQELEHERDLDNQPGELERLRIEEDSKRTRWLAMGALLVALAIRKRKK